MHPPGAPGHLRRRGVRRAPMSRTLDRPERSVPVARRSGARLGRRVGRVAGRPAAARPVSGTVPRGVTSCGQTAGSAGPRPPVTAPALPPPSGPNGAGRRAAGPTRWSAAWWSASAFTLVGTWLLSFLGLPHDPLGDRHGGAGPGRPGPPGAALGDLLERPFARLVKGSAAHRRRGIRARSQPRPALRPLRRPGADRHHVVGANAPVRVRGPGADAGLRPGRGRPAAGLRLRRPAPGRSDELVRRRAC